MSRILHEKVLCAGAGRPGKNPKNELIYKAVKYIREHMGEKIYLTDIARACSISNTECCRMFKRQVGQSPMEYVKKYRVKRSLDFLENKNCMILQFLFSRKSRLLLTLYFFTYSIGLCPTCLLNILQHSVLLMLEALAMSVR